MPGTSSLVPMRPSGQAPGVIRSVLGLVDPVLPSLFHTYTHTHACARAHARTHARAHTHTHTLSLSLSYTPPPTHTHTYTLHTRHVQ